VSMFAHPPAVGAVEKARVKYLMAITPL
jgi:hypothetical protein